VVLPEESSHIVSAMAMEGANCAPPKAAAPLPEGMVFANSTEAAGNAVEHCVTTWHRVEDSSATNTAEDIIAKYQIVQQTPTETGGARNIATPLCQSQNLTQKQSWTLHQNLMQNQMSITWTDLSLSLTLLKPRCCNSR